MLGLTTTLNITFVILSILAFFGEIFSLSFSECVFFGSKRVLFRLFSHVFNQAEYFRRLGRIWGNFKQFKEVSPPDLRNFWHMVLRAQLSTDLLQVDYYSKCAIDNCTLQQAGKIDNLQQVWRFWLCRPRVEINNLAIHWVTFIRR